MGIFETEDHKNVVVTQLFNAHEQVPPLILSFLL